LACMQARAGRNYTSSSLLATSANTVEGAVSARLRTTSADSPCSLGRSARLTVRCSSALKRIRALAWSRLQDEAVRNRCAEVVDSSAALRSGSLQTSGRWSIPVGRAPDVVSGKSQISLELARSAGAHGRKGTTYLTSSSSSVCVCLLPRRGAPDPGWLVCAGPLAATQSLRLRPRATDEACGSLPTVGAMVGHRGTRGPWAARTSPCWGCPTGPSTRIQDVYVAFQANFGRLLRLKSLKINVP